MMISSSFAPWQRRHLMLSIGYPWRVSFRIPSPLHTLHFLLFTSFFTAAEFLAYSASTKLRRSDVDAVAHHSSFVSIFLPSGWGWLFWPLLGWLRPPKPKPLLLLFRLFWLAFGWVLASVSRPPSWPPFTIHEPSP